MQIDRYGRQKCCKVNRFKIFQKLRLLWLFKVWSTMNEWWFFCIFCFSSFGYIFQDITISWSAILFLETAGHALSSKPLYDEIAEKIFWHIFWKFLHCQGCEFFLPFFKKKKFFPIKVVGRINKLLCLKI